MNLGTHSDIKNCLNIHLGKVPKNLSQKRKTSRMPARLRKHLWWQLQFSNVHFSITPTKNVINNRANRRARLKDLQ